MVREKIKGNKIQKRFFQKLFHNFLQNKKEISYNHQVPDLSVVPTKCQKIQFSHENQLEDL
jgi:hypothetical protein